MQEAADRNLFEGGTRQDAGARRTSNPVAGNVLRGLYNYTLKGMLVFFIVLSAPDMVWWQFSSGWFLCILHRQVRSAKLSVPRWASCIIMRLGDIPF